MAGQANYMIAFFGPTGVARNPAKLTKMLSDKGISEEVQQKQLRIVAGNATDVSAVRETLQDPSGNLASIIISGVGGAPKFTPNPLKPTLDQPTVCQDSMKTVVAAVEELRTGTKGYAPYVVAISTTGVDDAADDVPWLLHPLYHWLLPIPHRDKRLMEEAVYTGAEEGVFSHFTIIRPSLLTDGASCYDVLRAGYSGRPGTEGDRWNAKGGEVVGYTVSRADVGAFIFEEIINKRGQGEWSDKKVTLTY